MPYAVLSLSSLFISSQGWSYILSVLYTLLAMWIFLIVELNKVYFSFFFLEKYWESIQMERFTIITNDYIVKI